MIINNVTNEKEGGSVMKLFELIALENKEFDSFLIPLTHESLYSFWPEIESSERILHHTGKLLIDNLLATGDEANRFIGCNYRYGKIDLSTAKIIRPIEFYRELAKIVLKTNICYISSSILTEDEQREIEETTASKNDME